MTRIPLKLTSDFVCDKLSGHCPGCRDPVEHGEQGVVCEECKAYWHYRCANVTQNEIDTVWKEDFLCETHRQTQKDTVLSKMEKKKLQWVKETFQAQFL